MGQKVIQQEKNSVHFVEPDYKGAAEFLKQLRFLLNEVPPQTKEDILRTFFVPMVFTNSKQETNGKTK